MIHVTFHRIYEAWCFLLLLFCCCFERGEERTRYPKRERESCLLYTSDAADENGRVDLGGRRIIKKIFFQAEDGIRDDNWSRGLGDVYKRQG